MPNYPPGSAQSDCPQFTTRTDWAYDWSAASGVATEFSFNDFLTNTNSVSNPDAATETNAPTLIYGQVTVPDGTIYKQYYYPSPASANKWRYGLPKMSDTITAGVLKKRAKTNWEQPCGGGTIGNWIYQCNPRPAETNIYDNTEGDSSIWENRRRTTFTYAPASPIDFNLVADVYEYDSNATTVLRRSHTDYNQTATYQNRRIIGLPTASFLYDGSNALASKVEYLYDESGYLQTTPATPIRHDSTNYGVGFLVGRGNQTTVRRYDVTNQTYVEWKTGYNITGNPTFSRDPRYSTTNAQTTISYADAWVNQAGNNTANLNTFAYPTTVTDMDGYSSTVKYDFDLGAARFTTDPKGAVTMSEYDGYGRRWKTTSGYGSASPFYTSLNFDSLQNWVKSYSSIESGQPDFYSITVFDGHDRVRATVSDHPGSSGQYKGVYNGYDTMGRLTQTSNPTEINSSWIPAGDDVAGWAWSYQSYDWQSRPLVFTNQDGTTKTVSYTGCGCAGSDIATTTDEGTVVTNPGTGLPETKKRQQKVFRDTLGRVFKTQILNWENGSPYSTTINAYNVRDQLTSVKEYSGDANGTEACPSATCQITNLTYDGHGRLWKQRRPIETADSVYLYNSDDTLWKATDPRNVTATHTYNNRKLTTDIAYDSMPNAVLQSPLPSLPIPSASVSFGYDEAGNRTWMNDAPGRVDYVYDQLSQLKEETRLFDVSVVSRSFTLKYEYNLAGQLKQITDPWNAVVTYNRDKAGQETGMTATGYKDANQWTNRDVSTFASNIKYRAWGGMKQFTNGTLSGNNSFAMGYDSRLRLTSYTGGGRTTQHTYYNDGLVKDVTDLHYGNNWLRKYEYDNVSQLKKAHAGGTAQTASSPYSFNYNYDVWGNTNSRTGSNWSSPLAPYSTTYTNNRDSSMTYDTAGNVKVSNDPYSNYNAASQLFTQIESGSSGLVKVRENYQDGDGAKVFYKTSNGSLINGSYSLFCNYFLIRSSVLGGKALAEFKDLTTLAANDPLKYYSKSYAYLKGVQLGFQENAHKVTGDKHVTWTYHNPTVGTYFAEYQLNNSGGQQVNFPAGEMTFDPLGSYVGITQPPQPLDIPAPFTFVSGQYMEPSGKCYADYAETPCTVVQKMLNNGTGQHAPSDPYSTDSNGRLTVLTVDWDNGFYGFVPVGARRSQSGRGWYDPYTQTEGSLRNPIIGLGFGLTGGQQSDGRNGRTDCAWFVDGLIARLAGVQQMQTQNNNPFDRQAILGLGLALKAGNQNETHNQGWAPTGWKPTLTAGGQNGAVYGHLYLHIGAMLWGSLPVRHNDQEGQPYRGTGKGFSDHELRIDEKQLDNQNRVVSVLEKNGVEGSPLYVEAVRRLHENNAERLADLEGRNIGNLFSQHLMGASSFTYEGLRSHISGRLCQ
ncbi:MAG: RHS repeat domain-containing protein [Blastocatellia bacterium]